MLCYVCHTNWPEQGANGLRLEDLMRINKCAAVWEYPPEEDRHVAWLSRWATLTPMISFSCLLMHGQATRHNSRRKSRRSASTGADHSHATSANFAGRIRSGSSQLNGSSGTRESLWVYRPKCFFLRV